MFVTMGELVRAVGLRGEIKFLPDGDFLADLQGVAVAQLGDRQLSPVRVLDL